MPWLLDEDDALRLKLLGPGGTSSPYTVTNYADGRQLPINVYFQFPDAEEITRVFPYLAISLIAINFAAERAHRAQGYILNRPLEQATPQTGYVLGSDDMPLPWDLVYQIGTYSRQPRHDRQLQAMMFQAFPQDFGFLDMTNFDGTFRRADMISAVRRDERDATKQRLYHNIYTVSISSEFPLYKVQQIQEISSVDVTFEQTVFAS